MRGGGRRRWADERAGDSAIGMSGWWMRLCWEITFRTGENGESADNGAVGEGESERASERDESDEIENGDERW